MYLSRITVENFRIFGSKDSGKSLDLKLRPGMTLIVGENDSGKSTLLDAIRLVLGTKSNDSLRLTVDDFHLEGGMRATQLKITCSFDGLDAEEAAHFLEWLDLRNGRSLVIILEAQRKELSQRRGRFDREISVSIRAGVDGLGTAMEVSARDLLRVTYLRALRDAEQELAAKRGSRLSQVLLAHPAFRDQVDPVDHPASSGDGGRDSTTHPIDLVDIMRGANNSIRAHPAIQGTVSELNKTYLSEFVLGGDELQGEVQMSDPVLRQILEQLQLVLADGEHPGMDVSRGLGLNNLLFMATELLLLQSGTEHAVPLALIEEPEAHLHPQLQVRLTDVLGKSTYSKTAPPQIIMTSHSPNLASIVDIERLVVMRRGQAFPMGPEYTELDASDYRFLKRFLDVTKSNLFFARGLLIVEGDAEQIVLPVLAEMMGRSLSKHGVSIINVGHRGLFRYARVFQRKVGPQPDIAVACVTDRDIPPDEAKPYVGNRKTESEFTPEEIAVHNSDIVTRVAGGPVKGFVSPKWTFEYDLAYSGFGLEMHQATQLAKATKSKKRMLTGTEMTTITKKAEEEYLQWKQDGKSTAQIAALIYRPLAESAASKPETAQFFAELLIAGLEKPAVGASGEGFIPAYIQDAILFATRAHAKGEGGNR